MLVYVVTEEPYHENSTIVGVFSDWSEAEAFTRDRPNHPEVNTYDGAENWKIEGWEVGGECRRVWDLWRPTGRVEWGLDERKDGKPGWDPSRKED